MKNETRIWTRANKFALSLPPLPVASLTSRKRRKTRWGREAGCETCNRNANFYFRIVAFRYFQTIFENSYFPPIFPRNFPSLSSVLPGFCSLSERKLLILSSDFSFSLHRSRVIFPKIICPFSVLQNGRRWNDRLRGVGPGHRGRIQPTATSFSD